MGGMQGFQMGMGIQGGINGMNTGGMQDPTML